MERTCENCKYSCVDSAIAAVFCMGQKNMPRVRPSDTCDDWKPVYRTNGDAIRQMTDEELADYFAKFETKCYKRVSQKIVCDTMRFAEQHLDWLKQEVESDA